MQSTRYATAADFCARSADNKDARIVKEKSPPIMRFFKLFVRDEDYARAARAGYPAQGMTCIFRARASAFAGVLRLARCRRGQRRVRGWQDLSGPGVGKAVNTSSLPGNQIDRPLPPRRIYLGEFSRPRARAA